MWVDILLTCGKHLHERIISLREEVWVHKTSLTLPLFIEVSVPSQESEWLLLFLVFNWILELVFFVLYFINSLIKINKNTELC